MKKWKLFSTLTLVSALMIAGCGGGNQASSSQTDGAQADSSQTAQEQKIDYPTKPIQMIVPFAPGGTTDTSARALSSAISKYLPNGQTVTVVNQDGGGGTIGMTELFKAKPDGYTIGMATSGPLTIKPHNDGVVYKPEDFKPVIQVVATPNVMVVKSDAPWTTFEEWFEYAKAHPEEFTYGTSGAGLTQHITMENFTSKTGVKLKHVPFSGGSPALTALLGGNIMGALVQTPEAIPYVEEGSLRPIFVTGSFKPEALKDVPLLTEKGIEVAGDVWTGIVVPKDVPDEIVTILHDAFKQALEDPEVIEQFKKVGAEPVYKSTKDFAETILADYTLNGQILKTIGITK